MAETQAVEYNVDLERSDDGRIGWLRFRSTHKMNVMTLSTMERMLAAVQEVGRDEQLRVLVIAGADDVFSGGADLESLRALGDADYKAFIATEYELFRTIEALPCITVAALPGPCIGNAAEIALACDFRIARADLRFGYPELIVAFVAPAQRLSQFVGIAKAKELLYEGRLLDAEQALELGLITRIAEGDLFEAVAKAAERWARIAPFSIPLTKAGIHRCYGLPGRYDALEASAAFATFKSEDFQEGANAALERRRPTFSGR
jgi:enoyl-CoA hydratase/carnithine racemase